MIVIANWAEPDITLRIHICIFNIEPSKAAHHLTDQLNMIWKLMRRPHHKDLFKKLRIGCINDKWHKSTYSIYPIRIHFNAREFLRFQSALPRKVLCLNFDKPEHFRLRDYVCKQKPKFTIKTQARNNIRRRIQSKEDIKTTFCICLHKFVHYILCARKSLNVSTSISH